MPWRRWLGLSAAGAILLIWGGVLLLAAVERGLPPDQRWMGHAAVHVWVAAGAALVAVVALRAARGSARDEPLLRPLLLIVVGIAAVVVPASLLDAVGAYPTLRSFHDAVNAVAAPAGWALLASLAVLTVVGLAPTSAATTERATR